MINEAVTTDSAGIGVQGGYNDGDARVPFVLGTFKRYFYDEWAPKKKKRKKSGKQVKNKGKRLRKRDCKASFVHF